MKAQTPCLLVWDTETTGLTLHPAAMLAKQPRIIEFGGVLLSLDNGERVQEFSLFINPGQLVSEEITKITGITNAALAGQPSFAERLPELREIFAHAESMVAHNLAFDKTMLMNDLLRQEVTDFPWPEHEFCTMAMYTPDWGRNPKLKELYAALMGRPLEQTHRALDDVNAMVDFIQKEKLWEIMT